MGLVRLAVEGSTSPAGIGEIEGIAPALVVGRSAEEFQAHLQANDREGPADEHGKIAVRLASRWIDRPEGFIDGLEPGAIGSDTLRDWSSSCLCRENVDGVTKV